MRKIFLLLLCFALLCGSSSAAGNEISNMQAQVQVLSDGICRVTVIAEVRFTDAPKTFVFPLGTDADDISASGASFEEDSIGDVECVIFENPSGFSGTQTFQCSYTLPCALTEGSDAQHFTLQLPEQGWDYPIAKYELTVSFPSEVTALPVWSSAYYGDVIDNYMSIQVQENTVTANTNVEFKDHETLTMQLEFAPDTFELRHLPGRTAGVDRLLFLLLLAACAVYWFFRLRGNLLLHKPEQSFSFDSSAGEIPCQLYGSMPDMGALLAHWGSLGYLLIRRTKRGTVLIEKQMDMGNERSTAERRVFHALFQNGDRCDVESSRFLIASNQEAGVLRAHWVRRMFQSRSGKPGILRMLALLAGLCICVLTFDLLLPATAGRWLWLPVLSVLCIGLCYLVQTAVYFFYTNLRWFFLVAGAAAGGILFLLASRAECSGYMFFNLLVQLLCAYLTRFGGQRSMPGEEMAGNLLGFRRFLARADQDTVQRMLRNDRQYYYRALPYAELLGVARAFSRRFAEASKEPCRWLVDEKQSLRTAKDFYALYKKLQQQLRRKILLEGGILRKLLGSTERKAAPTRPVSRRTSAARPRAHSGATGSSTRRSQQRRSSSHRSNRR